MSSMAKQWAFSVCKDLGIEWYHKEDVNFEKKGKFFDVKSNSTFNYIISGSKNDEEYKRKVLKMFEILDNNKQQIQKYQVLERHCQESCYDKGLLDYIVRMLDIKLIHQNEIEFELIILQMINFHLVINIEDKEFFTFSKLLVLFRIYTLNLLKDRFCDWGITKEIHFILKNNCKKDEKPELIALELFDNLKYISMFITKDFTIYEKYFSNEKITEFLLKLSNLIHYANLVIVEPNQLYKQ